MLSLLCNHFALCLSIVSFHSIFYLSLFNYDTLLINTPLPVISLLLKYLYCILLESFPLPACDKGGCTWFVPPVECSGNPQAPTQTVGPDCLSPRRSLLRSGQQPFLILIVDLSAITFHPISCFLCFPMAQSWYSKIVNGLEKYSHMLLVSILSHYCCSIYNCSIFSRASIVSGLSSENVQCSRVPRQSVASGIITSPGQTSVLILSRRWTLVYLHCPQSITKIQISSSAFMNYDLRFLRRNPRSSSCWGNKISFWYFPPHASGICQICFNSPPRTDTKIVIVPRNTF